MTGTLAPPALLRRRAEMEGAGLARAAHAPAMADERAGALVVGRYRIPTLTLTPESPLSPVPHVFVHGGAWCMGSSRMSLGLLRRIAHQCRRPVVSLDYPLAPEHPWPAAIDATGGALSALAETGGVAGVIAASAGCHIALAALLRPARRVQPGAVLLINPALTQHTGGWAHAAFGTGYGLTSAEMTEAIALYAVPTDHPHDDLAVTDLSGLPPVWIACGDRDPLLDDSLRAFAGLIGAQNPAQLQIVPGAVHGFMNQWFADARADAALTDALDWLQGRCGRPDPGQGA